MFSKEGYIIPEKKLQQYKSTPVREWQGLTDDEIDKVYYKTFDTWSSQVDVEFARAVEQALKEKNHG